MQDLNILSGGTRATVSCIERVQCIGLLYDRVPMLYLPFPAFHDRLTHTINISIPVLRDSALYKTPMKP